MATKKKKIIIIIKNRIINKPRKVSKLKLTVPLAWPQS